MKTVKEYERIVLDEEFSKQMQYLGVKESEVKQLSQVKPQELVQYKGFMEALNSLKVELSRFSGFCKTYEDISSLVEEELSEESLAHMELYQDMMDDVWAEVDALKTQIEEDNKRHNQRLLEVQTSKNTVFQALEEKRKCLEKYSNKIFDLCSQYDIYTSDISMDTNAFTPQELNELYDEYIHYMSKDGSLGNPITWFRETFPDSKFQLAGVLIFIVLAFTPVMDVVALAIIAAIVYGQIQSKRRMKYYTVLMGVVFNIKPLELGYRELNPDDLLPESINEDEDERFKQFEEKLIALETEQEEKDPIIENQKLLTELELDRDVIKVSIFDKKKQIDEKLKDIKFLVDELEAEVNKWYEEKKANLKLLGQEYNSSVVFNTNFRIGVHDEIFEEYVDIGFKNLIINPGMSVDTLYRFIRVLWANAVLNVKPGYLTTYVYDPNEFGQVLIPFYTNDLDKLLLFEKDSLDNVLKSLTGYCEQNLKDMRGKTIFEFNKECEEVGKTPKEYKLLIVMSQPKNFEEGEALKEFLTYSSQYGVFVWLVSPNLKLKNTYYFDRPFSGVDTPYQIDPDKFCPMVTDMLLDGIKNSKTAALMWQDFVNVAIPENEIWTGIADEFIDLYPGFWNGDPTQYSPFTVGNVGNVHVIGVGGTGAGKSVFLNHIIACITRKYDPTEVELWLCDFKGTEFKFYLPSEEYPFMLPHIKACLCTSDGDYATSLFHAFRMMCDQRYEMLKEHGQKNMLGWNKFCRQKYQETGDKSWLAKKWQRVLFICDEFQVIFEKADSKNLESINADITQIAKVARACGGHIFFTSQSMKKTVSEDILQQFTLRFALRCDEEVSMSILGTKHASDIKEQNGYLIVRSVGMSKDQYRRYRTPFLPDSDKPGKPSELRQHIKRAYDRACALEDFKFKDVITYEEATKHPISELEEYYTKDFVQAGLPKDGGLFFLGNRMAYSENRAPMNVKLPAQNNRHIASIFEDLTDLVNFYKEVMVNIKCNFGDALWFINSQIKDLHYLCEVDKTADPDLLGLSDEKTNVYQVKAWVDEILRLRIEANSKSKPLYIILLGWDKAPGFGVDADTVFRSEFVTLLQTCAEYHIHFIFILTGRGSINQNVFDACQVKICGRCDENASYAMLNNKQGCKVFDTMKNGYMYVNVRGEITRVKLYVSPVEREIESDEFIVK